MSVLAEWVAGVQWVSVALGGACVAGPPPAWLAGCS